MSGDKKNVLTADERMLRDYIQTKTQQVLKDLDSLAARGEEQLDPWSADFATLVRTCGKNSPEAFRWFKYYLREGRIPAAVQLPLLVQIYLDSTVDAGFMNILARLLKNEPQDRREERMQQTKKALQSVCSEDGILTLYRGSFEKPFGYMDDASRPIEKAFSFTTREDIAKRYAVMWFPARAAIYKVSVPVEDAAGYLLYDEEETVVLLPKVKGGRLEILETREIPKEEYGSAEEEKMARESYRYLKQAQ